MSELSEEAVRFLADEVNQHFATTGEMMNGAKLADAIRARFTGSTWEDLGVARLADLVAAAERAGLVQRVKGVAHLEVGPRGAVVRRSEEVGGGDGRFVRPELWRAVLVVSAGRFLHLDKATGQIVSSSNLMRGGEQERLVPVQPIPSEQQRVWVGDFLRSRQIPEPPDLETEGTQWWRAFAVWLQAQPREIVRDWNRFRAARVIAHLTEWAKRNEIAQDLLFAEQPTPLPKELGPNAVPADETTRQAILAALAEMPLGELEGLAIPFRYVVRHFRAR